MLPTPMHKYLSNLFRLDLFVFLLLNLFRFEKSLSVLRKCYICVIKQVFDARETPFLHIGKCRDVLVKIGTFPDTFVYGTAYLIRHAC